MERDYRGEIEAILSRHSRAGEDLSGSVLAGAPDVIGREEALSLARWIIREGDDTWGWDTRYEVISDEILDLVGGSLAGTAWEG